MKSLFFISLISLSSLFAYSQSVGINEDGSVPDPSALLDIKSTSKGMLIPRMKSADRTGILNPGEGLLVYDNETASFWFYKAAGWTELVAGGGSGTNYWETGGNNIYNNNAGNVGIGTVNPTAKLSILTPINTTGWTHIGRANGLDSIIVTEGIGGVSASIGTTSNHAFRIHTNGAGKFSVYPAGEVVVGPNATGAFGKLTVQTTNNTYGISDLGDGGNILATRMGGTSAGIGTFSPTNMRIFSGGLSRIFIAEATGNVGIGIEFPSYKLEVNGQIRSKEVIVEAVNWPDYVFDEKYKLPSLKDVEKYILENKHLPNIPPAKEVEKKGLQLGDTQKRMMEKIEELTLYLIEKSKEIEVLQKRVLEIETNRQPQNN